VGPWRANSNTLMPAFAVLIERIDRHGFTDQRANIPLYSFTRNQFQIGLTSLF